MTWPFDHLLEAWRVRRVDPVFARTWVLNHDGAADPDALARGALEAALELIGQGEIGGNNLGPFVAMCVEPAKPPQNWCAGFVSLCYRRAAARQGVRLPFTPSLGAKRLGANVAAVGRRFTDPNDALPGDLMIFDRGARGSWMGHVALVEAVSLRAIHTVEGNCGPRVMRCARSTSDRERFAFFASLRPAPR